MTTGDDDDKRGRRAFLKRAAMAAGGVAVTRRATAGDDPPEVPEWTRAMGTGVADRGYGLPSPHEKDVVRRRISWLTASAESSISFTPLHALHGIITPNGLAFERHHAGYIDVDPARHRLLLHGLVDRQLIFTMDDIVRFPSESRIHFLECVANGGMEWRGAQMDGVQYSHGMIVCAEWTGVRLSTLLGEAGLKPGAQWVLAEGADNAVMTRSVPLAKALDDALVVYAQNGEMLRPEQGYPLRLLLPGYEGAMHIKWLRRLKVGDRPWFTREETSRYTDLLPDGTARQFTWTHDAKSVITFPCPERGLKKRGHYEISGLAWSGRGRIVRVDISTDGGDNWRQARLAEPVLSKCLTRFRVDWSWDGGPALLQSRAVDETGYVQPTLTRLRRARGTNSIYHNNAIQTWRVAPSGEVFNVQLA
jgi:sulfane dehydrogenase subunit SoxC